MNKKQLITGNIMSSMLIFALPMILGNMLQQCYNIVDTIVVGQYIGAEALAAVGSTYTLMTFLTSIVIGLCMGSGAIYSFDFGADDKDKLQEDIWQSFLFIGATTLALTVLIYGFMNGILKIQQIPQEIYDMTKGYCHIVFAGMIFIFLYNFFAYVMRSMGDSVIPLIFLGISSLINIFLDLIFVVKYHMGVDGTALATLLSQMVCGVGISIYVLWSQKSIRPCRKNLIPSYSKLSYIIRNDFFTCLQQSVMNFGILMIQGLVNSFGTTIMAAFTVAVKIDTLAYMPAQEYGNAFSLFISQNKGAGQEERIRKGRRYALCSSILFCAVVSLAVFCFAGNLMRIFLDGSQVEIIREGVHYLRIEGACYVGIGVLFLMYAYFRGIGKPEFSLVLTVISLGTRVVLAYTFAPNTALGVTAIWLAIPIGWGLADLAGLIRIKMMEKKSWKM